LEHRCFHLAHSQAGNERGDPEFVALEVGDAVWHKYIPEAFAAGKFQAKPDPLIIKGGLEKVQQGINLLRDGVSAKKIVIEISKE
jgi:hypothetical protein